MISRRVVDYTDHAKIGSGRFDLEGVTHLVTGRKQRALFANLPGQPVGLGVDLIAIPTRCRGPGWLGKPVYALNQSDADAALDRLTTENTLLDHVVVEDPTRPLPADASGSGTARIVDDLPERVVIETKADGPAYLVLADTFDPGWSATVDGQPAPIRPAYIAFRAVYLPGGDHTVVFTYRPAGFELGIGISVCGILLGLLFWFLPARAVPLAPDHAALDWPPRLRTWFFAALGAIVLSSVITVRDGHPALQSRWRDSFHTFTWGAGIAAMHQPGGNH